MEQTTHWVHNLDPMLFRINDQLGVGWYGLSYIAGFYAALAIHYLYVKRQRSVLTAAQGETALYAIILGIIAGARIGYVVLYYGLDRAVADPLFLFRVWEGGMSFHGGLIGVVLAFTWISWHYKVRFRQLADMVAGLVPPGLFFGRCANFINGELWGKPSDVPWAVIFPRSAPPGTPVTEIVARHPSQLYEATLEGLVLFTYLQWRYLYTDARKYPGRIGSEMLILYACARIFCEFFREPDASLILGISRGMFYSLFMIVAGVLIWWRSSVDGPLDPPNPNAQEQSPQKR
ncbi:MAG: prolipoprotein diacylglyceryl transferase [Candidatus Hydrogenedens sp.]|nr:prolipoprotein diacylglyceryl transferase [Candidatus Hydrogenedens sp.]